jgi:hypothetical protein
MASHEIDGKIASKDQLYPLTNNICNGWSIFVFI